MMDKFLSMLGICRKAGRMCIGATDATDAIRRKKAILIYIASDLSLKTEKELKFTVGNGGIPIVRTRYDMATLSQAIGIKTGVITILDCGFADALTIKYQGEN